MKNIRKRADGRWEYRKTVKGVTISLYDRNQKILLKKIKALKENKGNKKTINKNFIDLIDNWFNIYKANIKSNRNYRIYINKHFRPRKEFNQAIQNINLAMLQDFLTKIYNNSGHRCATYCYYIIKGTFKYAKRYEIITKDTSEFLEKPKNNVTKGVAFNLNEQKLILENLDKTPIKNEILFYVLTGCRRTEAKHTTINYEKNSVFIDGTKSKTAKRYVPISAKFTEILKSNFDKMFHYKSDYYSKQFSDYLALLKIKDKKLHDLRHTFSTNLYYLGVPDKLRQYYMGHSSIVMTNDIYTTLDPTITKKDILNLYKDLYPKF